MVIKTQSCFALCCVTRYFKREFGRPTGRKVKDQAFETQWHSGQGCDHRADGPSGSEDEGPGVLLQELCIYHPENPRCHQRPLWLGAHLCERRWAPACCVSFSQQAVSSDSLMKWCSHRHCPLWIPSHSSRFFLGFITIRDYGFVSESVSSLGLLALKDHCSPLNPKGIHIGNSWLIFWTGGSISVMS